MLGALSEIEIWNFREYKMSEISDLAENKLDWIRDFVEREASSGA